MEENAIALFITHGPKFYYIRNIIYLKYLNHQTELKGSGLFNSFTLSEVKGI